MLRVRVLQGLDVTHNDDFSNLAIGQGYSDYDLELISKFGIGHCLVIDDTRKRKSLDMTPGTSGRARPKVSRQRDMFSDDDDADDADAMFDDE